MCCQVQLLLYYYYYYYYYYFNIIIIIIYIFFYFIIILDKIGTSSLIGDSVTMLYLQQNYLFQEMVGRISGSFKLVTTIFSQK